jgi:hypothetical protein
MEITIMTESVQNATLDELTRRSIRAFWMDGLWDLALVGALLILGVWGIFYIQFVAFSSITWPFLQDLGRQMTWLGLSALIVVLTIYVWVAWIVVRKLKRIWISPLTGHAEHKFVLPLENKTYLSYFFLYLVGIGLLYGLFAWIKGGVHVMSVPCIISPAAALWVVGRMYNIRRYLWTAGSGLLLSIFLELSLTWPASYVHGQQDFLNVRPEWGSPALPCFVWAAIFLISGLIGFFSLRRGSHEA